MRRNIAVPRASMKLAAAVLAGGLALSACGTVKMGSAAITGGSRISQSTLTSQVANLTTAYAANKSKGIKPQRPVGQEAQQVLTWLILFSVYGQMAAQHNVSVTATQSQQALNRYAAQAKASKLNLAQYWSAGGALPPDLLPQLGQAVAIQNVLIGRLDGGKAPSSTAGQSAITSQLTRYECLAAKSLGVTVNPQYGEFDYNGFQVVPAPPTLAANPTPSPAATAVQLKPPCLAGGDGDDRVRGRDDRVRGGQSRPEGRARGAGRAAG
jgi:hypothetical protein